MEPRYATIFRYGGKIARSVGMEYVDDELGRAMSSAIDVREQLHLCFEIGGFRGIVTDLPPQFNGPMPNLDFVLPQVPLQHCRYGSLQYVPLFQCGYVIADTVQVEDWMLELDAD
jgi:hypothetical protein